MDTHINPSAGCLIILGHNLEFRDALYGWYLTAFRHGRIVYQKSEVHFAAVHPTELALYVSDSRREIALCPPKPFPPVFSKHAANLREFYASHKNWCNKNNDPCNPESFDSSLVGQVAINDREHALAFAISYQHIQEVAGDAQKPDGPDKVIYVFRNVDDEARLEYREMLPREIASGMISRACSLPPH